MHPLRLLSAALLSATLAAASAPAAAILIDFGAAATRTESPDTPWNNVDDQNQGALEGLELIDVTAKSTGILLDIVSPFAGPNPGGVKDGGLVAYPASAAGDSLFANIEKFNTRENLRPVLRLRGLDAQKKYVLSFFASRMGSSDNRTTRYTVAGATTEAVELDAANNTDLVAKTPALAPAADGTLLITLTPGAANTNANHFMYLGVLEITVVQ